MNRREFITLIGGAAAAWPLAVRAQQGERMRRIGLLMSTAEDDVESRERIDAFLQELARFGWTVGRNLQVDIRWPAGDADRIRRYAAELVALAPDVMLASRDGGILAAGHPVGPDRVRHRRRPGRRRTRREPRASRNQRHRICIFRIQHGREVARTSSRDCAWR